MILGLHNMLDAMSHFWREHMSSDGAMWILAMNALFLIPVIFGLFFYPVAIGLTLAVVALIVLGFAGLIYMAQARRRRVGHH